MIDAVNDWLAYAVILVAALRVLVFIYRGG